MAPLLIATIFINLLKISTQTKCQSITIPMCKQIGYNFTQLPNGFNHDSQEEAGLEVHQYWPLVEIKCSPDLRFFLCSLYVPICMEDYKGTVPPCRSVCLRARQGCEPVMTQYNFNWPERFECSLFPAFGPNSICMDERRGEVISTTTTTTTTPTIIKKKVKEKACTCTCKKPLISAKNSTCSLPCKLYQTTEEQAFSDQWILLWSSISLATTFFCLITFLLEKSRLNYPERPIIYVCLCYFFKSLGYLMRVYWGHESVACEGGELVETDLLDGKNPNCLLVFLLIFYFGLAAKCWWLPLSFSFTLATISKWGSEAISKKSPYFHIFSWVTPLLFFLKLSKIKGDPVIGICVLDESQLYSLKIVPSLILIASGGVFLLGGMVELWRIRRALTKTTTLKTEKMEKLMLRIGVYSILYVIPSLIVMAIDVYFDELVTKSKKDKNCCDNNSDSDFKATFSVMMIRHFLTLTLGLTTLLLFFFSSKTFGVWRRVFCFGDKKNVVAV